MSLVELTGGLAAWSTDPDELARASTDRSGATPDGLPDLVVFAKNVDDVRRTVAYAAAHRLVGADLDDPTSPVCWSAPRPGPRRPAGHPAEGRRPGLGCRTGRSPPPPDWVARANPSAIPVPVAGLRGATDPLSTVDDVRPWFARLPSGALVSLAGTAHDALNNQTHRTAAAVIVRFLERLRHGAPIDRVEQSGPGE